MSGPVWRAGGAEDVGDLERGAHASSAARRPSFHSGHSQPVERTGHVTQSPGSDPGVESGGIQPGVAEQRLDDADVYPVLKQVRGEAVPQRVWPDPLADARRHAGFDDDAVQLTGAKRLEIVLPGEQPAVDMQHTLLTTDPPPLP